MTLPKDMLFIDYETNGATLPNSNKMDIFHQRPVEVCAVRVIEGEVTSLFNTLVHYDGEWTRALANGHHTADDLRKGMKERSMFEIIRQLTMDAEVIVAYNALFDVTVTHTLFGKFADFAAAGFAKDVNILDPLTIARDRISGKHNLAVTCKHYGIELTGAHMAYDDTMALVELVQKMDREGDVSPYINQIGYKRQYGEPEWIPNERITLKPQGNETVFHHTDGTVEQRTRVGKPHQQMVMGKPAPAPERSAEEMAYDLVMGLRNAILEDQKPAPATPPARPRPAARPTPPVPN